MLSKKEKHVFKAIYELSAGRETFLITPTEVLTRIPFKINISRQEVENLIKTLIFDGYMELINSDKKGETIYCVTLTTKGFGFKRELVQHKRTIYFKIILTLATAVLGVIVTKLLSLL